MPSRNLDLKIRAFQRELENAEQEMLDEFVEMKREIAYYVFQRLRELSPVWTQRYKASHRMALNTVDTSVAPPANPMPKYPNKPKRPVPLPDRRHLVNRALRGQTGIHAIFSKSVADPPTTGTGEVDRVITVSQMDFHPVGTVLVDQCAVDTNGIVVGRVEDLLKPVDRIGTAKAIRNLGSLQSKQDTTRQIGRNSRR